MTWTQLLQAAVYYASRALGKVHKAPFQPCFVEGVQHFLIHAGGAKVGEEGREIREIGGEGRRRKKGKRRKKKKNGRWAEILRSRVSLLGLASLRLPVLLKTFSLSPPPLQILDGIGSSLGLEESYLTPSRAVLSDYGNVSALALLGVILARWRQKPPPHLCLQRCTLCSLPSQVSSSTTWYTLGYIESVRGVKRGAKVLQIGVGSGIKCGVNVFKVR